MSRHRNIRNIDYTDYYDDYDDYYDDYYDDDNYDDDYVYKKPTKTATDVKTKSKTNSKTKKGPTVSPASTKKKGAQSTNSGQAKSTSSNQSRTSNQTIKAISGGISIGSNTVSTEKPQQKDLTQKIPLITAMGFSAIQAQEALIKCNGDIQNAIETLLSRGESDGASTIAKNSNVSFIPAVKPPAPQSTPKKKQNDTSRNKLIQELTQGQRSRLSMVVLGHVDAGKSTLVGQMLVQLGHIEKRIVHKFQKQANEMGKGSFALAWVMDEDESERERGVTMEVGTKLAKTNNHDITILDAPGHRDFIPSMITGAASADVGLLVVAATPGEFEDGFSLGNKQNHGLTGQTREHIILSRGLGVSQLIVAVNKLDAAQPIWSENRFNEIRDTLMPFLKSSGFNMKRVRYVPISGLTGENVYKKRVNKANVEVEELYRWYSGPTLIEAINTFAPAMRNIEKPLRLISTDVYAEGRGVTVRGRVIQGFLSIGDKVVILPIGDEATVSRIENGTATSASSSPYGFQNSPQQNTAPSSSLRLKTAIAGDNTEIVLSGIDVARISPGCIICHTPKEDRVPIKKKFLAKIAIMENLSVPIIRGAQVLFHMHSLDVPATISKLVSVKKRNGTERNKPRVLTGGSSATVEITIKEGLCLEEFNSCRSLGRFVVRRSGDTIAVGVIEKFI